MTIHVLDPLFIVVEPSTRIPGLSIVAEDTRITMQDPWVDTDGGAGYCYEI